MWISNRCFKTGYGKIVNLKMVEFVEHTTTNLTFHFNQGNVCFKFENYEKAKEYYDKVENYLTKEKDNSEELK